MLFGRHQVRKLGQLKFFRQSWNNKRFRLENFTPTFVLRYPEIKISYWLEFFQTPPFNSCTIVTCELRVSRTRNNFILYPYEKKKLNSLFKAFSLRKFRHNHVLIIIIMTQSKNMRYCLTDKKRVRFTRPPIMTNVICQLWCNTKGSQICLARSQCGGLHPVQRGKNQVQRLPPMHPLQEIGTGKPLRGWGAQLQPSLKAVIVYDCEEFIGFYHKGSMKFITSDIIKGAASQVATGGKGTVRTGDQWHSPLYRESWQLVAN